jgi:peptidyl-tRNA hydrolase, PTH2 family
MDIRQVIVMRKDLNMRKGKIAAQAAHASLGIFFQRLEPIIDLAADAPWPNHYQIEMTPEMTEWKEGIFKKIVVYVESEAALLDLYEQVRAAGLPCVLITDRGLTEFKEPTHTCIGIGPCEKEVLDPFTGSLPLY